jgi:transposase InsO family protein
MLAHSLQGAKRRGKPWRTTTPDRDAAQRPDLVERDFTASRPDELYVADFTYLRCWEGMVFFAFVIDVYSRRVVGWQLAAHMRASLVCDALRMAVSTRPRHGADVQLIHHSDRGSQGEFKWCLQHLEREELRWARRRGVRLLERCGRRCDLRGVRRRIVRIGSGSGRRSLRGSRAIVPVSSLASRAWLASGGFVRVAGCDRSAGRRCRGATWGSRSARRSRC